MKKMDGFFLDTCFDKIVHENDDIYYYWGMISRTWGEYIDLFPYKKWKTYDFRKIKIDKRKQSQLAFEILTYIVVIAKKLKMNKELFYKLYMIKNEENFRRQMPGGIYSY